jgi:hypothetical protein
MGNDQELVPSSIVVEFSVPVVSLGQSDDTHGVDGYKFLEEFHRTFVLDLGLLFLADHHTRKRESSEPGFSVILSDEAMSQTW